MSVKDGCEDLLGQWESSENGSRKERKRKRGNDEKRRKKAKERGEVESRKRDEEGD